MSFIDAITPKDTEEVKPGLFIQSCRGKYRQVHPAAWNGKINWKNFLIGVNPIRNLFIFILILFLVFAYTNDVREYKDFYEEVSSNPTGYCENVYSKNINPDGSKELPLLITNWTRIRDE